MQVKGRLQCWSADGQELGEGKGRRPEALVEAAAEGFRGFKDLKAGRLECPNKRGQTAGSNALTREGYVGRLQPWSSKG